MRGGRQYQGFAHTILRRKGAALTSPIPARRVVTVSYDKGQVEITVDGCFECGTCRVLTAKTGEIEWEYPRGGYGVIVQVRLTIRRCQRSAEQAVRLSEADIDRVLEEDIRFGDLTVRALAIGEKPGRMVFTARS